MPLQERALIQKIRAHANAGSAVVEGIGDDCAVLRVPAGHELLVTTDFMVENVHFRRNWEPPEAIGQRSLTRGLSDIAAMGGEPIACFISLAITRETHQSWVDRFYAGLLRWARKFNAPLAGGDTAESPSSIHADIVVVGSVPRGKAILRSGAKPGDHLYVTGRLGASAAAIASFKAGRTGRSIYIAVPRLPVGTWLRQKAVASSMIDISDGLSTDLEHLCTESRVGAEIEETAVPRAFQARNKLVSLETALHGGEDYELLFTSSKRIPAQIAGVAVTRIGEMTRKRGMRIRNEAGVRPVIAHGWEHFRVDR